MFPIFDTQDRVVGFGARTLGDSEVKYLNTPETPIFSKGRGLYGLNWARKAIVDAKRVAVVEGYTDVIMAHQHGIENVVATLGTALTRENIQALRRFAERIDVVFDSDPAGQQAAERSMELFLDEGAGELVAGGFDVRITTFTGGKDPCDLIAD
jgi:DNA primase